MSQEMGWNKLNFKRRWAVNTGLVFDKLPRRKKRLVAKLNSLFS